MKHFDQGAARECIEVSPEVLRGGISKVDFQETLSMFGDKCPQNGSKNDPMAPRTTLECPREGTSVGISNTPVLSAEPPERVFRFASGQNSAATLGTIIRAN